MEDVQGQTTTYTYTSNNLTGVTLPTGAKTTYTYDNYHNVKTATTPAGVVYTFTYDAKGNNTAVSMAKDGTTVTSSAVYTSDGNRLDYTLDAAGNKTDYSYNANTNVLEWVQYPEDTEASRTEYSYDSMYRLASASVDVSTGSTLSAAYGYTNDLLTSIQTGSTTYSFTYGAFALRSNIKIGSRTLATYSYTSRTNYLASLDYGNGDSVDYTYDKQGRVTRETYEDGTTVSYKYDNSGNLATVSDSETGIKTTYYYDTVNRLVGSKTAENGTLKLRIQDTYNAYNQLTGQTWTVCGRTFSDIRYYNTDGTLNYIKSGTGRSQYLYYDELRRVDHRTVGPFSMWYTYRETGSGTTNQIAQVEYKNMVSPKTYTYTYDGNGNIAAISDPFQGQRSYTYDSQGQLLNETIGDTSYIRSYDDAGNILTASDGTTTHTYTYGDSSWGDLLTAYDGQSISYDTIGNPTSYYNGTRWTFSWEQGRELTTASNGTTNVSYKYDANGIRTSKTVDGKEYKYYYSGGRLMGMTIGSNMVLTFFYDQYGRPYAMNYNNLGFLWYMLNQQGDVVALIGYDGAIYATYEYDAWGNITHQSSDNYATVNPLRYRGYVYDEETQLYYCNSRYYDPQIGRFINADSLVSTGQGVLGNNMFAYCNNNPVNYADPSGDYSLRNQIDQDDVEGMMGSAAVTAALAVAGVCLLDLIAKNTAQVLTSAQREIYEFAQTLKDLTASKYANHQPRVHHIVPWGRFSNRLTSGIVRRMQDILIGVGIDPKTDPLNQIVISHGHHKSIHTNSYLLGLYAALERAEGNRDAVETALYFARIYIAFTDPFSIDY